MLFFFHSRGKTYRRIEQEPGHKHMYICLWTPARMLGVVLCAGARAFQSQKAISCKAWSSKEE